MEKNTIKVSLGTVICIVIILVLLAVIGYLLLNQLAQKKLDLAQIDTTNTVANINQQIIQNENSSKENNTDLAQYQNAISTQQSEKEIYEITYKEEIYKSYNQNGNLAFESKRNLPVIKNTSNQSAADEIVKSLNIISNEKWEEITNTSDKFKDSFSYGVEGVYYLFSTYLVNDKYIVFKADRNGSFGGTTWLAEEYYNFDTKTGKRLTLKNISSNYNELEKALITKTVNYINNDNNNITVQVDDVEKTVTDLINSENGIWGITRQGLEIKLPKYSIGPGADGIITVIIDKTEVNKYLLEDYKIK